MTPTSNHNRRLCGESRSVLYIFWLLHQTTTWTLCLRKRGGCISFDSYIKPQLSRFISIMNTSCISFDSYIKPQLDSPWVKFTLRCISFDSYIKPQQSLENTCLKSVVYLLTPTSNHNLSASWCLSLQVVYLLTPTSNHNANAALISAIKLYIFWLLHQTTTVAVSLLVSSALYIFWLLHQTTTLRQH